MSPRPRPLLAAVVAFTALACPAGRAAAQGAVPTRSGATALVELTETDITRIKDIRSDRISVHGVTLGMTRAQAERILGANPALRVTVDTANPTRLYVYRQNPPSKDAILYYIWEPGNDRLSQITIFRDCAPYLRGATADLLTLAAVKRSTEPLRSFLGAPARSAVTLDVTIINLKHVTYYHEARGIAVTHQLHDGDERVVFALVPPGPASRSPRR